MTEKHIANIVVTTYLSEGFDLDYIAYNLPGSDYNPAIFPGITYIIDNPRCAVLILRNGRVAITGPKSMEDAQVALENVVGILNNIRVPAYYNTEIKILNIVGYSTVESEIDLHSLFKALNTPKAEFNPEKFPGIIYHMGDGIDMLIFHSGKVVFTGAKSMETFETASEMGVELVRNKMKEMELLGVPD